MHAGLSKKVEEINQNRDRKVIKAWSRSSTTSPQMIDHTTIVYDGRKHVPVYVIEDMAEHKLGEFALTRILKDHIKNGKTSKRK